MGFHNSAEVTKYIGGIFEMHLGIPISDPS